MLLDENVAVQPLVALLAPPVAVIHPLGGHVFADAGEQGGVLKYIMQRVEVARSGLATPCAGCVPQK